MHRRSFLKKVSTGVALAIWGNVFTANHILAKVADQIKVWSVKEGSYIMTERVNKTDQEWQEVLTDQQFRVARKKVTEHAFTGEYDKHYETGVYQCVCCGQDLFHSDHKYDSKTGWPSYYQPIAIENIALSKDTSWLMVRNAVHCSRCDGHLGHVFEDGPKPTGLRYCINSASLKFVKT